MGGGRSGSGSRRRRGIPCHSASSGWTISVGANAKSTLEGLAIVVPAGRAGAVSLRLPFLNHAAAKFALFTYTGEDIAEKLDPADYGNVQTVLDPCMRPASPNTRRADFSRLRQFPGFEAIEKPDGSLSLRVNGWEMLGVAEPPGEARLREIESLAQGVSEMRSVERAPAIRCIANSRRPGWRPWCDRTWT